MLTTYNLYVIIISRGENTMKYYSIHEFSKLINVTPQTLRKGDKNGNI